MENLAPALILFFTPFSVRLYPELDPESDLDPEWYDKPILLGSLVNHSGSTKETLDQRHV